MRKRQTDADDALVMLFRRALYRRASAQHPTLQRFSQQRSQQHTDLPFNRTLRCVRGGKTVASFDTAVAKKQEDIQLGLGFYDLPRNRAMLFDMDDKTEKRRRFWMKNCIVPLDMLFLDRNMEIQEISNTQEAVPLKTPNHAIPTYESESEARYVVELLGGTSRSANIKVKDTFVLDE